MLCIKCVWAIWTRTDCITQPESNILFIMMGIVIKPLVDCLAFPSFYPVSYIFPEKGDNCYWQFCAVIHKMLLLTRYLVQMWGSAENWGLTLWSSLTCVCSLMTDWRALPEVGYAHTSYCMTESWIAGNVELALFPCCLFFSLEWADRKALHLFIPLIIF